MSDAQSTFITGMARANFGGSCRRSGHERPETWVFVWNDVDKLVGHLHGLVQDPESSFGVADMLWVMAAARRQVRSKGRQQHPNRDAVSRHNRVRIGDAGTLRP